MDSSFTREEQRFVLAEMIKSSTVDIENLVLFVKSNGITPDWLTMQLPLGRNMKQCMQVAETLSIPSSHPLNPRPMTHQNHHATKAVIDHPGQVATMMSPVSHHSGLPPAGPSHVAILPRPANGIEDGRVPPQQVPREAARKRGRPSRADKAKNDLRHHLPHIAPRPPQPASGPDAPRPRTILPATSRYLPTIPPLVDGPRSRKRRRTASAVTIPATAPSPAPAVTAAAEISMKPANNNPEQVESVEPQVSDSSTCTQRLQSPFHLPVDAEPPSIALLPAPPASQIKAYA